MEGWPGGTQFCEGIWVLGRGGHRGIGWLPFFRRPWGQLVWGAGHYGPVGLPPPTCLRHGLRSLLLVEVKELGRGLLGRLQSPQEDPQVFQSRGRPPKAPPTCCGQGKAYGGLEDE